MNRFPDSSWSPDRPDIEALLTSAQLRDHGLIPSASNYVFLVELEAEGAAGAEAGLGYAIYKPERGETPLWDFPPSLYKREVATYLVSRALGWGLVPPTVLRKSLAKAEFDHGVGSLQLFIPGDRSQTYFDLRDEHAETMRRFATFDWLTNNADRKGGHVLLAPDGHIWGIDHGLTLHAEEKLRTVIWDYAGEPVPPEWLADIASLCTRLESGGKLRQTLAPYLDSAEIGVLQQRAEAILREPTLPQPPVSRRPYPWPLI